MGARPPRWERPPRASQGRPDLPSCALAVAAGAAVAVGGASPPDALAFLNWKRGKVSPWA
eukprot:6807410-Alexandrium_andersonii.AAC.1